MILHIISWCHSSHRKNPPFSLYQIIVPLFVSEGNPHFYCNLLYLSYHPSWCHWVKATDARVSAGFFCRASGETLRGRRDFGMSTSRWSNGKDWPGFFEWGWSHRMDCSKFRIFHDLPWGFTMGFTIKSMDMGFSCKFSLQPIHRDDQSKLMIKGITCWVE